jgi:hypothetical protein
MPGGIVRVAAAPVGTMFDRFIRFAEARKALQTGHFEQVLRLVEDPAVVGQRKAAELRERALRGLLERARRRAGGGALSAARADVERVLAADPECDDARALRSELRGRQEAVGSAAEAARAAIAQGRALAEENDLPGARAALAAARELCSLPADELALTALIEGRARAAARLLEQARNALAADDVAAARAALAEARSQDPQLDGIAEVARAVAVAYAPSLGARAQELATQGDCSGAVRLVERALGTLPELADVEGVERVRNAAGERWAEAIRTRIAAGEFEAAAAEFRRAEPRLLEAPSCAALREPLAQLAAGLELRDRGDFAGASENLAAAGAGLRAKAVRTLAAELAAYAKETERALSEARTLAAQGNLVDGRRRLLAILERWPMHEAVRREMEVLDQGAQDQEQRLARARSLAKDGKLSEASALAVALAVAGPRGEEARLLLTDLQGRMDLVTRGLDQVRRAVHGRDCGSVEGVEHSLRRLEQLAKVWQDHAEMQRLQQALTAEVDGLRALGEAAGAVRAQQPGQVCAALERYRALEPALLGSDRLQARVLDLADAIQTQAQGALAGGRLAGARSWLAALESVGSRHESVAAEHRRLAAALADREGAAEHAARDGLAALERRDVAAAEESLERARAAGNDGSAVRRLEEGLQRVRAQAADLVEVERLAAAEDYGAAGRKLAGLPPTSPMLRTRIFDLKQNLARAQGLDYGFLLRVDEGGEFLVLRGDSITVGNVREGTADLALLANVAGRHARIARSMSFHGGMQDRVVAERGEVWVDGKLVQSHVLRSGDRVRLGSALEVAYAMPSARSLSALLTLRGGYQVAGTDKILLLKDRGRDGRILIGAGRDAHVRVPHPGPVEIYATGDGQVRVRAQGGGEMNGRPFSGEHPVTAGAPVRCGQISFVLQPLARPS